MQSRLRPSPRWSDPRCQGRARGNQALLPPASAWAPGTTGSRTQDRFQSPAQDLQGGRLTLGSHLRPESVLSALSASGALLTRVHREGGALHHSNQSVDGPQLQAPAEKRLPMATVSSLFIQSSISKPHRFRGILVFNLKKTNPTEVVHELHSEKWDHVRSKGTGSGTALPDSVPARPLTGWVTLGKWLTSVPQLPPLENGQNKSTSFAGIR